jgi:superfamily I DNA/RNA helicase
MDYLKEYAKQAEDVELAMLIDIVEEYGKKTISLLHRIKEKTEDEDREKASYIFSTVHKSKGMEYDEVILEEDFWNEEQIEKFAKSPKPGKTYSSVLEEVNLLYVAVTRAKTSLQIPESLLPKDYFVPGDDLVKSIHNTNKGFSGEIRKKKREVWMDQADDDLNAYLKKKGLG